MTDMKPDPSKFIKHSAEVHPAQRGFSLVELIIAISILVTLTGSIAPMITRYIEGARAAVCYSNRDAMRSEILYAYAAGEYASLEEACKEIPAKPTYAGKVCPAGGKITCTVKPDGSYASLTITCDHAGHEPLSRSVEP